MATRTSNKKQYIFIIIIPIIISGFISVFFPYFKSQYFDEADLRETISTSMIIYQEFGNIHLQPYIQIRNEGDANGTIKKITGLISNNEYKNLLVNKGHFFSEHNYVPASEITLNSKQHCAFSCVLGIKYSENEEYKLSSLKNEIVKTFIPKCNNKEPHQHVGDKDPHNIIIPDSLSNKVDEFVDARLKTFTIGKYLFLILFEDDIGNISKKAYSFTVYDFHIDLIKKMTDEYKLGNLYRSYNYSLADLLLDEIKDEKTLNSLYQQYSLSNTSN